MPHTVFLRPVRPVLAPPLRLDDTHHYIEHVTRPQRLGLCEPFFAVLAAPSPHRVFSSRQKHRARAVHSEGRGNRRQQADLPDEVLQTSLFYTNFAVRAPLVRAIRHDIYLHSYIMKKVKLLLIGLFATVLLPSAAQQPAKLPADNAIRQGKLPNGLTYYIRHNAEPKGQVNFYIAQKVGSIQENDDQRGLAHFLEHMAFNGSKHFPNDGQLIKYCESIGVKFGENLNAYTSTDETVYNIDNVPVAGNNVDSCLFILADWSGGLLLQEKEINKERGVIHEEWRMRSSPMMRIFERRLPELYPGSKYGYRLPIGLMSIVDNFKPDFLRAYYKKWYRPDLQGVVIVGDIDAAQVEAKVKQILGAVPMPANAAKYETYPVPDNAQAIYVIDKDKEQTTSSISIMLKTDVLPQEYRGTLFGLIHTYMISMMGQTLNGRLNEMSQKQDCPFISAGVDYGTYLLSKTKDAFSLYITPKPGRDAEAVTAVMKEVKRLKDFGVTGTELLRARDNFLSTYETLYNNRDKQKNGYYVGRCVRDFLDGTGTADIATLYNNYKLLSGQVNKQAVDEALLEMNFSNDSNFVFFAMYPDKADVKVPTVDEMKAAVQAGRDAKVEAYVDNVKSEPLVPTLPKAGRIVKTTKAPFGYTQWTLSNGARVFFKKTDFNDAQILMTADSWGGSYKFADKDVLNGKLVQTVMSSTGLGNFTATELEKKLAGKQVSLAPDLGKYTEGLSGSSTPKDLRTLFELVYLYFQKPANDPDAYHNVMASLRTQLENADKNPQKAFADSVRSTIYDPNPRIEPLKISDLDKVSYDEIKRLYSERFASAGDFDFYFTGALNEDSLRTFCEQYIAPLPGVKKRETYTDLGIRPRKGMLFNRFERQLETPQAMLVQVWNGEQPYNLKDAVAADAFGQVLTKRYLKSIREDHGMAYSVGADASLDYGVRNTYSMQVYAPFTPEKCDSVLLLMREGLHELAKNGVRPDELEEVKRFEIKQYEEQQRNNNYWQALMVQKNMWNKDDRTGYLEAIKSLTSADVQRFANKVLLRDGNCATIIMLPKGTKQAK